MTNTKKGYQAGIRMSETLWEKVNLYATAQGISPAEYCRRALKRQVEIDEGKMNDKEDSALITRAELTKILETAGIHVENSGSMKNVNVGHKIEKSD